MSDTNTTNANPGKFELIKNYSHGLWELKTPNPALAYILAQSNDDPAEVVYQIGRAIESYRRDLAVTSFACYRSITLRDIAGIKQLIGGW